MTHPERRSGYLNQCLRSLATSDDLDLSKEANFHDSYVGGRFAALKDWRTQKRRLRPKGLLLTLQIHMRSLSPFLLFQTLCPQQFDFGTTSKGPHLLLRRFQRLIRQLHLKQRIELLSCDSGEILVFQVLNQRLGNVP